MCLVIQSSYRRYFGHATECKISRIWQATVSGSPFRSTLIPLTNRSSVFLTKSEEKIQHLSINLPHPSVHSPPSQKALTRALRIPQSRIYITGDTQGGKYQKWNKKNEIHFTVPFPSYRVEKGDQNRNSTYLQPRQHDKR
jgi:hypothetical protein